MYNPQNVEKSSFGQSVCVFVCLAVAFLSWLYMQKNLGVVKLLSAPKMGQMS